MTDNTLGKAHAAFEAGRTAAAAAGFQSVLADDPGNAEALYFLAVIAYQAGRVDDALDLILRAAASRPDAADCHNLHGLVLIALGRHAEACDALHQALACEPGFADAENNLGAAFEALGDFDSAEAAYRHALAACPEYAQAHGNLGRVLLSTGHPAEAERAFGRALALLPDYTDARLNLAVAQHRQGNIAMAEATVAEALAADPQNAELLRYLGALRLGRGDLAGAETVLREALALRPDFVATLDNLAAVLLDQGRPDSARETLEKALAADPDNARIHSNLLLCRNYGEEDADVLFQAHRDWGDRHAARVRPLPPQTREAPARLRIGYVSGDFRRHSVAFFFEPLLANRDRAAFEVFCYANLENPDTVTARLRDTSDHWRWAAGLDDAQLATRIREDGIDILIDLSGHTAGNRLLAFQRRPAPVQATWLGYPNTTGLPAMDYRITDAVADPPGADALSTETLVRLVGGFLCYRPPEDAPGVSSLPARTTGHVTFGSFNNLRKVTPDVIGTWAEILRRSPTDRLLLKARPLADPATAARVTQAFQTQGIDPERLTLRGPVAKPAGHLASYGEVDIALDPFPYNGTTTTCEALWMGVPVVTLAGNRHAGRVGASLLTQVGLDTLIAPDRDAYVATVLRLAEDTDELAQLRASLRERVRRSPLCDGVDFCRRMEDALQAMWRERTKAS